MKYSLFPSGIALILSAFLSAEAALDTRFTTDTLPQKEAISEKQLPNQNDAYLQGYVQALVDMHYPDDAIAVQFQQGHATLSHMPIIAERRQRIITFVQDIPEVKSVSLAESEATKKPRTQTNGIFLPESSALFKPLIADPRQPNYSAAYRFNDGRFSKRSAAVSSGDQIPLYRWHDIGIRKGDLELDLEGASSPSSTSTPTQHPSSIPTS